MNNIKFSLIVPVYNVEEYLKKCLDSIINQTYKNYEVIVVCDKCTDKSEKIVDDYVKRFKQIKKIYKENTGLSIARNVGVEEATGEYLLFVDSDDYIDYDFLEVLSNTITDEEVIRFQAREVFNEKFETYFEKGFNVTDGVTAFKTITSYHFIENAWLYCYQRKFWNDNSFEYMPNRLAEDYGLTPLILYKSKKVKSIEYVGYNYVQRKHSLMNNNNYDSKIKKIEDMLVQSDNLKMYIKDKNILSFINMSLIYYITTLKKEDYKKYHKILRKKLCYNGIKKSGIKGFIRYLLIKYFSYSFFKVR